MVVVEFKLTNDQARYAKYALRKLYDRDKRTGLSRLAKTATLIAIADQAKLDLDEAERKLDE